MRISRNSIAIASALLLLVGLASSSLTQPIAVSAATAVGLGTADSFVVLAGSAITATNPSVITGDVGLSPGGGSSYTGLTTLQVTGTIYAVDAAGPAGSVNDPTLLGLAKDDLVVAYDNAAGQVPASTVPSELGGTTKTPGIYDMNAGIGITGTVTLDGLGDINSVFIFRTPSTLTTAGASHVNLINGAQACNIFWQIGSSATLGTTSDFKGSILALDSITDAGGSTIRGRMLARNGAVTLDNTTITKPTCAAAPQLTVTKSVTNDNGGTKVASDFSLSIDGSSVTSGVASTTLAGLHTVSETSDLGYTPTIGGDCAADGTITLAPGDVKTCTITNDDVPTASINVVKVVINDSGRTRVIANFPLFVDGVPVTSGATNVFSAPATHVVTETVDPNYTKTFSGDCDASGNVSVVSGQTKFCIITNNDIADPAQSNNGGAPFIPSVPPLIDVVKVPSPLALPLGPGAVEYTYTLRNIGTVPVTYVTMVGDTCSPITLISGDTNADSRLEVSETWVYTCSTTLASTHTNTVVATGWANGLSAVDIASATVIVGAPVVPPLIHVTKVPSQLTLGIGGGLVTYTEKVSNPGAVALSNIQLTDDRCSPTRYISGDTNGNAMLEPTETWTYTCRANLARTTTNTAVATGVANGLTVRDFAIATVVVPATIPRLPDTGFAPE